MAESFTDRARRHRRAEGTNWTPEEELDWLKRHPEDRPAGWEDPEAIAHDLDLIPEVEIVEHHSDDLQPFLDGLDVFDVYQRYVRKPWPRGFSPDKRETQVSCPIPGHNDLDPSCSINGSKGTWHCYGCEIGGDKYDIFAYHNDYAVPGYKHDGSFPKLRRQFAEDFGATVTRTPGGTTVIDLPRSSPPEIVNLPSVEVMDAPPPLALIPDGSEPSPLAPVLRIVANDDPEDPSLTSIQIDWESLLPPDTFMWDWMHACTIDDLPHEYYFFLGMMALAAAVGADVYLEDYLAIKANLFIVLYGKTGAGKSRALRQLKMLLEKVLPYNADAHTESKGSLILPTPGSAEALLDMFDHPIQDASTMAVTHHMPVRGLVSIEEFASFAARASRHGNPMKETLIELHDVFDSTVSYRTRTGGLVKAKAPFCQTVTTTQPKAIHNFMRRSDADSGFMNRFLFAVGTRRVERISYGAVTFDMTDAENRLRDVHTWSLSGHVYTLTDDAFDEWNVFFREKLVPLQEESDESMFSRIDLLLKKFMIIFAVNEKSPRITVEHVRMSMSLFDYIKATSLLFSTDLAHSEAEECSQKVIEIVEKYNDKNGKPCSRRDIIKRMNGKYPLPVVNDVLRLLEQLDLITFKSNTNKHGPATKGYVVEA